nr:DoxX family protein [Gordonia oryzae]
MAGAIGLVLPEMAGIVPVLSLIAAIALAVLQQLAGGFHLSCGEIKGSPLTRCRWCWR